MPESLLEGLDPEQRQIAECLRGPVAVLAGAGTGKTRTITHRIAHGVRTGAYAPERVLAVTFTRKAAGELQARLRGLGAEGVSAQTFHGAALAQLGYFWPQLVGGSAPQLLSGGKATVLAQAADGLRLRLPPETLRDIAAEIEWRKNSMLSLEGYAAMLDRGATDGTGERSDTPDSPDRSARLGRDHPRDSRAPGAGARPVPTGLTAEQLLDMQERYGALLDERRLIDFEDVLILATGLLETEPRAAMQMRERYRFFTVDEYQDVNPLQHALLRVWLGDRDDVCVVGDASQTIYGFTGASGAYLLRFGQEHPNAREFRLERNYRSTEPIVRLANRLMRERPGALALQALRGEVDPASANPPSFEWFASDQDEAEAVAASIRAAISDGTPAAEIAVLYRTNAQSAAVEAALQRAGTDARVHGAQRFFDRAEVRQAVMVMRGQAKVVDDRPLFQIVSDVLRACGWQSEPPEGGAAREKWQALNAILSLVDEQPPGTTVQAFSEELLARSRAHHEPSLDAVTLSAVHAAKGLEWSLVHVIGMSEGLLPIVHAESEAAIDEERRLAYVAFTRARDALRISGSAGGARGRRVPSRFLVESGLR